MKIALGTSLCGRATGESAPQINITAEPVIAQSDTNPQGTATVSSGTTSDSTGFAIVSSEWVHSVLGDVQSNTSPYTKPAGAAYTLRLKQVVSATDLPNKTVYSNTLTVDALSITTTYTPDLSGLVDGNTIADNVGDWEDADDTLFYASNGGTISSVALTYQGTFGGDENTTLDAGDTVGVTRTPTDSNGNSLAFVTPPVTVAAKVPAQVTGLSATPGDTEVALSWSAPDDGGAAITGYLVERNINGGGWTTLLASHGTTSYTNTGLTNDTPHQYRVSAINSVGTGPASSVASATPTETDVTAPTMTSLTFGAQSGGDAPITIAGLSENCTAYWVLTSTDQSGSATAAQVKAGTVTDTEDSGSFSASVGGGPYSQALATGLDDSLYLLVALEDAEPNLQSTVYDDGPQAIDTQSPTGTITGTTTGETTATIGLNLTNEAGDIGDFAVYPSASTPTQGEIEAGTGATWSVQDVTLTAGDTNDQSATGLTENTGYKAHAVVTDAQGQKTTLVSATFTTDEAASGVLFTDDFNRPYELLAASANWVDIRNGGMSIADTDKVRGNGNNQQGALYTGAVGANQYTQLEGLVWGNSWVLILRAQDGDNFYGCRFEDGDSYIYKLVAGAETNLTPGAAADTTTTYTSGDVLYFEANGTTLTAKVNGVTTMTITDATFASGDIGFMSRGSGANRADNFEGGDL